ncbi:unnamed protein product [Protopolystoma xenopodis]|uniref:Uncharacterized protein n=1 Tax=Protopolystoma xenopodis TaxID=117903 RepID=A0A3S5CV74_9PLAT|nr:unnamed protein product [Protopolystoma xenopodis]
MRVCKCGIEIVCRSLSGSDITRPGPDGLALSLPPRRSSGFAYVPPTAQGSMGIDRVHSGLYIAVHICMPGFVKAAT